MATNGGGFSFASSSPNGRNGLPKITTDKKKEEEICHDDSGPPVKAQTIDELHSLQKKKSAPTTPIKGTGTGASAFASIPEQDRNRQQLQSISASLDSLTRETGPKVVRGDPARGGETPRAHVTHHHSYPTLGTSDSALKFTHILYNLSPADKNILPSSCCGYGPPLSKQTHKNNKSTQTKHKKSK